MFLTSKLFLLELEEEQARPLVRMGLLVRTNEPMKEGEEAYKLAQDTVWGPDLIQTLVDSILTDPV